MAIKVPGKAHATVGLDIFFSGKGRCLNGGNPSSRCGKRQLIAPLGQRPDAVIRIASRQRIFDIHCGKLVLNCLVGTNRSAKCIPLQRIVSRLHQSGLCDSKLLPSKQCGGAVKQPIPFFRFQRSVA